jgi:hypothetical protein
MALVALMGIAILGGANRFRVGQCWFRWSAYDWTRREQAQEQIFHVGKLVVDSEE